MFAWVAASAVKARQHQASQHQASQICPGVDPMLKSQLRRQDCWFAEPSRLYHLVGMLLKFYLMHSVHLQSSVQVPWAWQARTYPVFDA